MAVPVLQAGAQRRLNLTKQAAGGVPASAFMLVSGEDITSWSFTRTSGTDGHWTTTTDGQTPTPSAAGVAAALGGGPYVFDVTATNADGTSNTVELTITVPGDVAGYTVSKPAEIDSTSATLGLRNSTTRLNLGGRRVEIARYSDSQWSSSNVCSWRGFNTHAAETRFTVTSEDASNPTTVCRLTGTGVQRADFVDINCRNTLAPGNTSSNAQNTGIMLEFNHNDTFGASADLTFTRIDASSAPGSAPNQWVSGFFIRGQSDSPTSPTSTPVMADGVTFTDCRATRVKDGFKATNAQNCLWDTCVVDSYCSNAHFWSRCLFDNERRNCITVRAFANPADPDDHADAGQIGSMQAVETPAGSGTWVFYGQNLNGNQVVNEIASIADGDRAPQGIGYNDDVSYTRDAVTGFVMNDTTYRNIFSDTPASQGFHFESGTGWDVERLTNVVGLNAGLLRDANGEAYVAPRMNGPAGTAISAPSLYASGIVRDCAIVAAGGEALTCFPALADDNLVLGDFETVPTADWSEANRIAFFAAHYNDPGRAIDFASLTAEEIADELRIAWAPKTTGRLRKQDGTYHGFVFPVTAPDTPGAWNDGTIFEATPPTAITSSAAVGAATVGEPVTITFQLDAAANESVSIDPAVSGVTGAFVTDPLSIGVGEASGQVVFTATSAGTASITATNNRSLANPDALVITITSPVDAPTLYTQTPNAVVSSLGNAIEITYVLDEPATVAVTITPACTLAGSFTSGSTVVIPFGQTTGSATFVPSVAGVATFSATNDRSLANPANVGVTVTACNVGQLVVMGMA